MNTIMDFWPVCQQPITKSDLAIFETILVIPENLPAGRRGGNPVILMSSGCLASSRNDTAC
jgi:hypothetical protein